jgi:hypothetical protein
LFFFLNIYFYFFYPAARPLFWALLFGFGA